MSTTKFDISLNYENTIFINKTLKNLFVRNNYVYLQCEYKM